MTNSHKTHLTIVLDETGSMMQGKDQTISGFNEFLQSQEDKALGECWVTLIKFNSSKIETVYAGMPVADCPSLSDESYKPEDTTPLYDAVAKAIQDTEKATGLTSKVLSKMAGHDLAAGPTVIVMVLTDGEENASRQYTQKQVFDMIAAKKKAGWAFVFMGTEIDSWGTAAPMGLDKGSVASFARVNTVRAYAAAGQAMTAYRCSVSSLTNLAETNPGQYTAARQALASNFFQGEEELDEKTAAKYSAKSSRASDKANSN